MKTRRWRLVVATLAASVAVWGVDPGAGPILGVWKLNPEKSKSNGPFPKSLTYTWAAEEGGMIKLTRDEINSKGIAVHSQWLGKFDGKDYPDTAPGLDTMWVTRTGERTFEFAVKKQGKVMATQKSFVSEDGRTLTNVNTGQNEKGEPQTYTAVMEKQ